MGACCGSPHYNWPASVEIYFCTPNPAANENSLSSATLDLHVITKACDAEDWDVIAAQKGSMEKALREEVFALYKKWYDDCKGEIISNGQTIILQNIEEVRNGMSQITRDLVPGVYVDIAGDYISVK